MLPSSINIKNSINYIVSVLKQAKIYDVVVKDNGVYVGGSLPAFAVARELTDLKELPCSDIDLYTTNYVKSLHNVSKHVGNRIGEIKRTGVNLTFTLDTIPVQIITSEFESFYDEVLGNYDCNMVSVGYHPYSNTLLVHENFSKGLNEKKFVCWYELSNPNRIEKLKNRAKEWFDSELEIVKQSKNGDFRPYYRKGYYVKCLQDVISPPAYVQLYYNQYKCISCNEYNDYLMCKPCLKLIGPRLVGGNKIKNKRITVLGGLNGLGKIVANAALYYGNDVKVTSRSPKGDNCYQYELGKPVSDELMEIMLQSNIIVLNAYQTLEGDQKIWTTILDTFDEDLARKRLEVNTFGYVKFLQQFVKARKEYIRKHGLTHNIHMVMMDANESRFEGKLKDGKHLELNLAKTATKQIFYTNANLLASLGIITICYDPGWLSYHGISVDQIASKSKYLIPPHVSALALLYKLSRTDFDRCIHKKKVIFDTNVYRIVDKVKIK